VTAVHIRTMTPADLDFASACTEAEGWGAQRGEFEGFYAHTPEGCLVAETDGRPIGICVATPYDGQGFLGMLIVRPEERGRGVGRRLIKYALAYLHGRGVQIIGLDGVLAAVPLYERLGFRKQCRSLRFRGTLIGRAHPARVRRMTEADLDAVCALDRLAFGADRSFILERRLAQRPALCLLLEQDGEIRGFALGRRVDGVVSVGPWVARPEVERPADLLEAIAAESEGCTLGLGILASNEAAVDAARALGLTSRENSPWRMVSAMPGVPGPGVPGPGVPGSGVVLGASSMAYAVGSPATG
jgi:ribosomal protein S18 acetylase RimI-like enzyme